MVVTASFASDPAGNQIFSGQDDAMAEVTLPFNFVIDGIAYASVDVSTNGWIEFGGAGTNSLATNSTLPTHLASGPFVAAYWDDLTQVSGYASAVGEAPNRIFSIEWGALHYQTAGGSVPDSLIVILLKLHEGSNLISVTYRDTQSAARGTSATIGFQHAGGSSAKAYPLAFNTSVIKPDLAGQGWSISPVR